MPQERPTSCCTSFASSQTKSPSLKLHFFYTFFCSTLTYLFELILVSGSVLDTGDILVNTTKFSDSHGTPETPANRKQEQIKQNRSGNELVCGECQREKCPRVRGQGVISYFNGMGRSDIPREHLRRTWKKQRVPCAYNL